MKLWLVSQTHNGGYDTYDCAVVLADTEKEAKEVGVGGYGPYGTWAAPEHVTAKYIGEAVEGLKGELSTGDGDSIICASFNAG